jgi:uncharacterized RDD family membrane protein YckC
MACPLCGDVCHCSFVAPAASPQDDDSTGHTTVFIDPDAYELDEAPFPHPEAYDDGPFPHALEGDTADGVAFAEENSVEEWSLVGATACPAAERRPLQPRLVETPLPSADPTLWRDEVASRVESFRARRRRTRQERSLSFDFGQPNPVEPAHQSRQYATLTKPSPWEEPGGESWREPERPAPEESKIIEFPKPPVASLPVEELAEPMLDKPRILDAPEQVETSAPLADINLEPPPDETPASGFLELPLEVALMSHRAFSGLVDALLVLLGAAVFVMITLRFSAALPHGKLGTALLFALPAFFWALYQYLFLVYAGRTPGMQMARLQLVTFTGGSVCRPVRRWRALATVLSGISLGLGLLWAFADEDTLCWHDRITRTYVTPAA